MRRGVTPPLGLGTRIRRRRDVSLARDTASSSASLMQLMWLASPALPIGGFSYSECLEAAVDTARVATEAQAAA